MKRWVVASPGCVLLAGTFCKVLSRMCAPEYMPMSRLLARWGAFMHVANMLVLSLVDVEISVCVADS